MARARSTGWACSSARDALRHAAISAPRAVGGRRRERLRRRQEYDERQEREKLRVVEQIQKSMLDHGMGVEEIIGLFSMQDTSGDGSLSYVEFKSMLIGLGIEMKLQDAEKIVGNLQRQQSIDAQKMVNVMVQSLEARIVLIEEWLPIMHEAIVKE